MKSKIYFAILLFICLFSIHQISNAQSPGWLWAKSIGGTGNDVSYAVAVDDSGNIYSTGTFEGTVDFDPGPATNNLTSSGILDIFILKLDSAGNFIWAKSIGGIGTDAGYGLTMDGAGSVYITGRFTGTVDFDPGVATSNLTSAGYFDVFVSKFSSNGNFLWAKSMGGVGDDESFSIALDAYGNIFTTGYFSGTADFNPDLATYNLTSKGSIDGFICKLENSGNFIWAISFGGVLDDSGNSVTIDSAGNAYSTGHFTGTVDFDPGAGVFNITSAGGNDVFVLKLDPAGKFLWAGGMGSNQTDFSSALAVDISGSVYSTGNFRGVSDLDPGAGSYNLTAVGNSDIFVSKLNDTGNFVWAQSMGSSSADYGYSIAVDKYGDIYTTGLFRGTVDFDPGTGIFNLTSGGNNDIFITKSDSAGNFIWAKSVAGQYDDKGVSLTFDHLNHLILTGTFMSHAVTFGYDTLTNAVNGGATADFFVAKLDSGLNTAGIENMIETNDFYVYPNPANQYLDIRFPLLINKTVVLTVTDITGKTIFTTTDSKVNEMRLNTNDYSKGVYLVQVQTIDFVFTKKVVIIK